MDFFSLRFFPVVEKRDGQLFRSPPFLSFFPLMFPILLALVWKLLLPALLIVALVDVLTQTRSQQIRRLSRAGQSQRAIAARLGVSRYQVRMALA